MSTNSQHRNNGEHILIRADYALTVQQLAQIMDISVGSFHSILTEDLKMQHVCAVWVSSHLIYEQLQKWIDMYHSWKWMLCENSSFLKCVITINGTWDYHHNLAIKCKSTEGKTSSSPPLKKIYRTKLVTKVLLCVFFDKDGVIYQHVVSPHITTTMDAYTKVLENLHWHLWSKYPDFTCSFILYCNNARPHTAKATLEYLVVKEIKVLPHPPCSPDLARCDFWLFPKLKNSWKTGCFPQMRTSSRPAIRYSFVFQPPNSLKYFRSGSNFGSNALKSMGAILK